MSGGEANSCMSGLDENIMRLEKIAFNRGIAELKIPAVEKFPATLSSPVFQSRFIDRHRQTPKLRGGPSLLIIDDDADIRAIIREFFERQGFEVIEAVSSEDGIKCQIEKMADVIIVEIILPGTDGIETILTINEKFPDVRIIGMSRGGWYGTDIDFDMAEKLGARTIAKPFLLENLGTMVNGLLNEKKSNAFQIG